MSDFETHSLIVTESEAERRLDAFLAEKIGGWSRSRLQKLIEEGAATVNEKTVKPSYKTAVNDVVEVELIHAPNDKFTPENIALDVVFEDSEIIVINKPAGMVVHPGAGITGGTLANALAFRFGLNEKDIETPRGADELTKIDAIKSQIGMVHRLDKDTSGLIVIAKTLKAQESLAEQFHNRSVFKSYVALTHGETDESSGTINAKIGRDSSNRLRMAISKNGRDALSLWKVRKRFQRFTLLDVEIKTGRTHQIRVHLASIKHPVVGDILYNGGRDNLIETARIRHALSKLDRFFLHAEQLEITHPTSGERISFRAELPAELQNFLQIISE